MEDWAEIRRLHRADGMPIKAIARVMGVSRNTVQAAVASDRPPKYRQPLLRPQPALRRLIGPGGRPATAAVARGSGPVGHRTDTASASGGPAGREWLS